LGFLWHGGLFLYWDWFWNLSSLASS